MKQFSKKIGMMIIGLFIILALSVTGIAGQKKKPVTIAYFPGWPGVFEIGWAQGWFKEELGVDVRFVEFDTGAHIITAMGANDVDIAYALGTIPFCTAVTQGLKLKLVAISEAYGASENLAVRQDTGINHPRDLIGKKLAAPHGTTAHYRLLGILSMYDIRDNQVQIYDMPGPEMVAAFRLKNIDGGCAWEPALSQMIDHGGKTLVSPVMLEMAGYSTYGTVTVSEKFAKRAPDTIVKFLQVLDRCINYLRTEPAKAHELVASKAGLTHKSAGVIMNDMGFITLKEQTAPAWIGSKGQVGAVNDHLIRVAKFLVEQRNLDRALPSFETVIDSSFIEMALE